MSRSRSQQEALRALHEPASVHQTSPKQHIETIESANRHSSLLNTRDLPVALDSSLPYQEAEFRRQKVSIPQLIMPFIHSRDARASIDDMGRYNADSEHEVDVSLGQRQDSTWGSSKQRRGAKRWLPHAESESSDDEDFVSATEPNNVDPLTSLLFSVRLTSPPAHPLCSPYSALARSSLQVHPRFTRDDLRPFDQAPYPPRAPEARDLPRAVDDDFWCEGKPVATDYNTGLPLPSMAAYDYERYHAPQQPQHYAPAQYHLPPLEPYHAQQMSYPPADHYAFAPYTAPQTIVEDPAVTKDILTTALSQWYAERVVELLIQPGFFRPGVDGADSAEWGRAGRERDEWRRVGRAMPRETSSWGRMGMEPVASPRYAPALPTPPRVRTDSLPRRPEFEQRDPYNLGINLSDGPSKSLVGFVKGLMAQMTVSPVGLFSALWFLQGLGWHAGDGAKGARLRAFLQSLWNRNEEPVEAEGIERRVVVLGMLLANKWLDDNTFTNRSWSDVTHIPIGDIAKLETIALNDLHYSLYISPSSWAIHIGQIHHHMTSGQGALELAEPWLSGFINHVDSMIDDAAQVENYYGPIGGNDWNVQEYGRDTAPVANPWAVDSARLRQHEAYEHPGAGFGWGREAEANMATFDWNDKHYGMDNVQEVFMEDEDDVEEEEFLEYDGAQVFEPVRRTSSNRSMMDLHEPQAQPQRSFAPPSIVAWSAKTYEHMPKSRQDYGYPGQQRAVSNERDHYQSWSAAQFAFEHAEQAARKPWVNAQW